MPTAASGSAALGPDAGDRPQHPLGGDRRGAAVGLAHDHAELGGAHAAGDVQRADAAADGVAQRRASSVLDLVGGEAVDGRQRQRDRAVVGARPLDLAGQRLDEVAAVPEAGVVVAALEQSPRRERVELVLESPGPAMLAEASAAAATSAPRASRMARRIARITRTVSRYGRGARPSSRRSRSGLRRISSPNSSARSGSPQPAAGEPISDSIGAPQRRAGGDHVAAAARAGLRQAVGVGDHEPPAPAAAQAEPAAVSQLSVASYAIRRFLHTAPARSTRPRVCRVRVMWRGRAHP